MIPSPFGPDFYTSMLNPAKSLIPSIPQQMMMPSQAAAPSNPFAGSGATGLGAFGPSSSANIPLLSQLNVAMPPRPTEAQYQAAQNPQSPSALSGMDNMMAALNSPMAQLGIGLMSNSGPSMRPQSLGQSLAGAYGYMQSAQKAANEQAMQQMSMRQQQDTQAKMQQIQSGLTNGTMTQQQAAGALVGALGSQAPQIIPALLQQMQPQLNQQQKTMLKVQGQTDVKRLDDVNKMAADIPQFRATLDTFERQLAKTPEYAVGPIMGYAGKYISKDAQAMQSTAKQLALNIKGLQKFPSSGFSDADVQFLEAIAGGGGMDKGPIQETISRLRDLGDRAERQQQTYQNVFSTQGSLANAPAIFGAMELQRNQNANGAVGSQTNPSGNRLNLGLLQKRNGG